MIGLILFLVILAIMLIIIALICYAIEYSIYTDKNFRLKFKDFKTYYFLNPDSWELDDYTVRKKGVLAPGYSFVLQDFSFSFIDVIYYKIFKNQLKRKKINKEVNSAHMALIDAVQKDINDIRKKANKEIEESSKIMIQVKKNFMKEEI